MSRRTPRLDEEALTPCDALRDEDDLVDVVVRGDVSASDLELVTLRQCRLDHVAFTGTTILRGTFVDCVFADCELSGAVFEDCRFDRVEFRRCRMSGVQAQGSRFTDVGLIDCRIDDGNFRMTAWERGELLDCNLRACDFYAARMPGSRLLGCDLTDVELSKCDLSGSHVQRSHLDGIRGGDALRGVTIGSDQLIPAALAVFAAMGIAVDDDEPD